MPKLRIVFQNNTAEDGLIVTPVWVGIHNGNFDLFEAGEKIETAGMLEIAEEGSTYYANEELLEAQPTAVVGRIDAQQQIFRPGPATLFYPGDASGTYVESGNNTHLTYAAKILPSNDAFIGSDDAVRVFADDGSFLGAQNIAIKGSDVYDAGAIINNEFDASFISEGPGSHEDGVIATHKGFKGSEGNPLADGEEAFILGKKNYFGFLTDSAAADFTRQDYDLATLHINLVTETDGTDAGEQIIGDDTDDLINAGAGDDTINGGAGWDVVDGGSGIDTYQIDAKFEDYSIEALHNYLKNEPIGFVVSNGNDDRDQLSNVEIIDFDDAIVTLATDGTFTVEEKGSEINRIDATSSQVFYQGTDDKDALVLDGVASDYAWGPTEDGNGTVVWTTGDGEGDSFFITFNIEQLIFTDTTIELEARTINEVGVTQHLQGNGGKDVFIIDANAEDYGISQTEDGTGIVVWSGDDFDVLNNYEEIIFNDQTVDISGDVFA